MFCDVISKAVGSLIGVGVLFTDLAMLWPALKYSASAPCLAKVSVKLAVCSLLNAVIGVFGSSISNGAAAPLPILSPDSFEIDMTGLSAIDSWPP